MRLLHIAYCIVALRETVSSEADGSSAELVDGSSGYPDEVFVDFAPIGTNYNFTSGSSDSILSLTISGIEFTAENTMLSLFGLGMGFELSLFPEVARQTLAAGNQGFINATSYGFNIPLGFDLTTREEEAYSDTDTPVVLEGTPFRTTPGLSSGDYVESPDPIPRPSNSSDTLASDARLSPIWYGSVCSAWQQNVIITQYAVGALIATCLDPTSVKSAGSVAGCIRRMLPRLSTAAGYEASSWSTNCFVCLNEVIQSVNLWDPSVKSACADMANPLCPVDIVAAQFTSCSGFDLLEPAIASFCEYTYNSADLFQSMIATCVGTAESGDDMKACVQYTIAMSGVTDIDANCLATWAYLLEATDDLTDKSDCQTDVTSSGCTTALLQPLTNFATWAGYTPNNYYYGYDTDIPGPQVPISSKSTWGSEPVAFSMILVTIIASTLGYA